MSAALDPGFTPAPDCIRDDIDVLAALVFGAVWRWCQMDRGQCEATVEAIAKRAGCSTTAARIRLRALERRGWLTAETRPTKPTIYRDSERWQLRPVGVDTKATRDVGQRETLARSQRETLAKATRDVAPLKESLQETPEEELFTPFGREESREVVGQPEPSAPQALVDVPAKAKPPRGAFTAKVKPRLVATLTAGVVDLAVDSRTGKDRSWVGQCLGALGRWTHNDADAALGWLDWWRCSEHWRFRGNDPAKWPAAMAAARDAYNDRPAAHRSHGPVNLDRRVGDGAASQPRGPINLDRR